MAEVGGESKGRAPIISVIIFAREAAATIAETLSSLAHQDGMCGDIEVVVADCSSDGTSEIVREQFPWVRHLQFAPGTMPAIKAIAIREARGDIVAFLDAHDAAEPGWLAEIRAGFIDDATIAIGGAVTCAGADTAANRAAYLFEYGAFEPPMREGPTRGDLPGNNVAYRRRFIVDECGDLLSEGFYKPFFHERLRVHGGELCIRPAMGVRHLTHHRLWDFASRRFHYGRCFGARRLRAAAPRRKLAYVVFAPAIPLLLVARHLIRAARHPASRIGLLRAAIPLVIICIAWGVGEWLGYWFGEGKSCEKVY